MNDGLFLVACVPVDQADKAADWLTDDDDQRYQALDPLDLPDRVLDRVYDLYRRTYASLSARPLVSSREALLAYDRWVLFTKGPVVAGKTPTPKRIVGFAIFKVKHPGLKAGLKATDGSPAAKRALLQFSIRSYNTEEGFGEVSPPLETKIRGKVPIVQASDAKRVLEQLGKTDVRRTKGDHYKRRIGNLGLVEKLMVGRPKLG